MFIAFAIPLLTSTLMDNYLQLLFLHSSPVGLVITRYLEILFDPPNTLSSLLLCNNCLLALWMLSLCLTIFVSILRHRRFDPIDST